MPTRLPREPLHALVLAALAALVALVLIAAGGGGSHSQGAQPRTSWQGLAGGQRPKVAVGQRVIVVLNAPALADRLGNVGGLATDEQERRWTATALASQKLLISRLGVQGVPVQPEYSYTRVINGFSAAFDANGLALLERSPEVAGVYPVRPTYPAAAPDSLTSKAAPGFGHPPEIGLSSDDGRGVTVALLDTGVDRAQPYLRGRVTDGVDVVGGGGADAEPKPNEPAVIERHGTEMAGIIVGAGGPGGMAGVAPGATVLPIRVAGWQRDANGLWSVYGRTDQLLAGLERAVDPNGDGDAHDAARVALVALAEPFAAFTDSPLARAAEGALKLDTLVVAAAGNDGPAGPGYGSIGGPGGAPAALTVGAADLRDRVAEVRVVAHAGLSVELDTVVPLAGNVVPRTPVDSPVGAPRLPNGVNARTGSVPLEGFFDARGRGLVADRAALVPVGADPASTYANAARAGATAVLFYGGALPGGALGAAGSAKVPAVSLPVNVAERLLERLRAGVPVTVSVGSQGEQSNDGDGHVAEFSSTGLAFDGRVKPELVAPGVAVGTAEPTAATDGSPRYGVVNGTSAAAALVAGEAALLAQARPDLDAESVKGLLVGSARPLAGDAVTAQGAGLVDVGGAASTELAALPTSLALGRATSVRWYTRARLRLQNLSIRPLHLSLEMRVSHEGAAAVHFDVKPAKVFLDPGRSVKVRIIARPTSAIAGNEPVEGALVATPTAGHAIRVPWVITFGPRPRAPLAAVHLSARLCAVRHEAGAAQLRCRRRSTFRRRPGRAPAVARRPRAVESYGRTDRSAGADARRASR